MKVPSWGGAQRSSWNEEAPASHWDRLKLFPCRSSLSLGNRETAINGIRSSAATSPRPLHTPPSLCQWQHTSLEPSFSSALLLLPFKKPSKRTYSELLQPKASYWWRAERLSIPLKYPPSHLFKLRNKKRKSILLT